MRIAWFVTVSLFAAVACVVTYEADITGSRNKNHEQAREFKNKEFQEAKLASIGTPTGNSAKKDSENKEAGSSQKPHDWID